MAIFAAKAEDKPGAPWAHYSLLCRYLSYVAIFVTAGACSSVGRLPVTVPGTPTPVQATADQVASAFFHAWEQGQYDAMYDLLAQRAREESSRDVFARRYKNIHDGIGVTRLTVRSRPAVDVTPSPASGGGSQKSPGGGETAAGVARAPAKQAARVPFEVTRSVTFFGDLSEANELPLALEPDGWRVVWHPGLIFKDLTTTSVLRVIPDNPRRGRILDRNGVSLADNGTILSIGVVPGRVSDEVALLKALSEALGLDPETIKRRYQGGQPDWFMPIVDRPESDLPALEEAIGAVSGVAFRDKPARIYPLGTAAGHLTGYVSRVNAEDLKRLAERGYGEDDWIGRSGLEAWAEDRLAGQKGGKIAVVDPDGRVVRTIAERKAVPGSDVHLTIDAALQERAATVLGDRVGSAVVMDPRDNAVLAIASHPSFDPNRFIIGLTEPEWQELNAPSRPLVFRAAESAYATGSIFKVITLAAGVEQGGFRLTDRFDCGYDWRGLPGVTLHNWKSQGVLDLVEALAESCNPAFYSIGLKLDSIDPNILPGFARAFGLGQPTGVEGVNEISGTVPDPEWKRRQIGQDWYAGDSVNLAIGQGFLLATPLQMANAYSALANGGVLRTPLLVQSFDVGGRPTETFAATDKGNVPIAETTRRALIEGMKRVVASPQGTASVAFRGTRIPVAAKTGSAENEGPDAHAWFVGFSPPDQPTTLVLVMVEGGQLGGATAAPLGRQLIEAAFPLNR